MALRRAMWRGAGPVRNAAGLKEALEEIKGLGAGLREITRAGDGMALTTVPVAEQGWR